MKKLEIKKLHLKPFMNLVSSISKVDNFISLRITEDAVNSSVWFPDKDAVKKISMPIETFFEVAANTPAHNGLLMCFYNGTVVNSIMKRFEGPSPISAVLSIRDGEDGQLHVDSLTLKNDSLKIKIPCSDPSTGFQELPAQAVDTVFNYDSSIYEFELSSEKKSKFEDLTNIDPDVHVFTISNRSDGMYMHGSTYELRVSEEVPESAEEINVNIFKKFLTVLDKDDYLVRVSHDKTFFESLHRDVRIVFANAEY